MVIRDLPRCLLLPITLVGMAMVSGCFWGPFIGPGGEGFYTYDTSGRILASDGSAQHFRVLVKWGQTHQFLNESQLRKMFRDDPVVTDATGLFQCRLVYGAGPTQATFGPPTINEVFLYVEQSDGWHVYSVQLDTHAQERTQDGRKLIVPSVVVGRDLSIAIVPVPTAQPTQSRSQN